MSFIHRRKVKRKEVMMNGLSDPRQALGFCVPIKLASSNFVSITLIRIFSSIGDILYDFETEDNLLYNIPVRTISKIHFISFRLEL